MACALTEDSDQPDAQADLSDQPDAQADLSDQPDAQADLSLCWMHMPFCRVCHALAQINFI